MILWTYFGHYDDENYSLIDREYAAQVDSHMAKIITWNPEPAPGESNIVRKSPDEIMKAKDKWQDAKIDRNYHRILNNLNVCALAEQYNLPGLAMLARSKFCSIFSSKWTIPQITLLITECRSLPSNEGQLFEFAMHKILARTRKENPQDKVWDYRTERLKFVAFGLLMVMMRKEGQEAAATLRNLVRILATKDYAMWVPSNGGYMI